MKLYQPVHNYAQSCAVDSVSVILWVEQLEFSKYMIYAWQPSHNQHGQLQYELQEKPLTFSVVGDEDQIISADLLYVFWEQCITSSSQCSQKS